MLEISQSYYVAIEDVLGLRARQLSGPEPYVVEYLLKSSLQSGWQLADRFATPDDAKDCLDGLVAEIKAW